MPDEIDRRTVLIGGVAVVAGCSSGDGVSPELPWTDDGIAARVPEDEMQKQYDPIHLTADTVIQPNSTGGVNSVALKNPDGRAMELLEVRFNVYSESLVSVNAGVFGLGITGATMGCKLDLGGNELTNGYVPVWNFGPGRYDWAEPNRAQYKWTSLTFIWKLARPLYIPAGQIVVPSFYHFGLVNAPLNVRINYACRQFKPGAPKPKSVILPYVAAYKSKSFDLGSVQDTDQSAETDLFNKFAQPLNIEHFTGRFNLFNSTTNENLYTGVGCADLGNVRMTNSNGAPIIYRNAIFNDVFTPQTRAIEVKHKLDPGAFYTVFITKTTGSGGGAGYLGQYFVGMTGWREIK